MEPLAISQSEMQLWRRCPRHWFTDYYLGYLPADPAPTGSANFGTRMHVALEGLYGYELDPVLVLKVLYAAAIEAHPDFAKELSADLDMAVIMAEGYREWVAETGKDATLKVVALEEEVRVPLPGFEGIVDLRAKMDQVVLDTESGILSFLDHKTASDFLRGQLPKMDPQMKFYALVQWLSSQGSVPVAGEPFHVNPDAPLVLGGKINTLRKVKRTKLSKPPYYDRADFMYNPDDMASALASAQQVAAEILNARAQLDAGYENSGAAMNVINHIQRTVCRPVPLLHDCSWSCHLSKGLCTMMDDGSHWAEALVGSGEYVQGDPYERYGRPGLAGIRDAIAHSE